MVEGTIPSNGEAEVNMSTNAGISDWTKVIDVQVLIHYGAYRIDMDHLDLLDNQNSRPMSTIRNTGICSIHTGTYGANKLFTAIFRHYE